jgi:hypothetical protein
MCTRAQLPVECNPSDVLVIAITATGRSNDRIMCEIVCNKLVVCNEAIIHMDSAHSELL